MSIAMNISLFSFDMHKVCFLRICRLFVAFLLSTIAIAQSLHAQARPILNTRDIEEISHNPVIVIHGILGSKLVNSTTQEIVWGKLRRFQFWKSASGPDELAFPMRFGESLDRLGDDIVSDGTLAHLDINLLGIPIEIEAYGRLMQALGVAGYRDAGHQSVLDTSSESHFTCFQFDYDWRRDISENAVKLDNFIRERQEYVSREYARRFGIQNAAPKFDIVAHSMGGLLARYYLRYGRQSLPNDGTLPTIDWSGARQIEKVVLIGTPNDGSVLALRDLVNGYQPSKIVPFQTPVVLGTMPSIYQLLPTEEATWLEDVNGSPLRENIFDPAVWESHRWGLMSEDADKALQILLPGVKDFDDRLRIARDYLAKCLYRASQFHHALNIPSAQPSNLQMHLFAGSQENTASKIRATSRGNALKVSAYEAGDDTTTLRSALSLRTNRNSQNQVASYCTIAWSTVNKIDSTHRKLPTDDRFVAGLVKILKP